MTIQPLHPITIDRIDADAAKVIRRLNRHDFEAYLVGGCVRDLLLGHEPKDFDVATNATPDEIRGLFRNCRIIGRRFRLAHIFFGRKIIETATFRSAPAKPAEGSPLIWRDNEFGTAVEDAARRDFTINGLFYDVASGKVLDAVDGLVDLRARRVRTIGDPLERLQEDPVRILRAIKFAARLQLQIDAETEEAMVCHRGLIASCAVARVLEEIYRLLRSGVAAVAFRKMHELGILAVLFPEITALMPPPEHPEAALPVAAVRASQQRRNGPRHSVADDVPHAAEAFAGPLPELKPSGPVSLPHAANGPAADDDSELNRGQRSAEQPQTNDPPNPPPVDEQAMAHELLGQLGLQQPEHRAQAAEEIWQHLEALDQLVRQLDEPPSEPILLGATISALASKAWADDQKMGRTIEQLDSLVGSVAPRLHVSRRHRERLKEILIAQRRLFRVKARRSLLQREYLQEALQLLSLRNEVTGDHTAVLARWREMHRDDHQARPRRRRRRRRPRARPGSTTETND